MKIHGSTHGNDMEKENERKEGKEDESGIEV
jgi:hypothetical protein